MPKKKQHSFKGFDDPIEIFKAGTHTDSEGRKITITTADLDQMVNNFDAEHPFPYVLGHPKDDAPAVGWAGSLSRDGDSLYVDESVDLNPEFVEACESKAFRNRSVSIMPGDDGYRVRHLGFLGAVPPAIKGLKPMQFNDADTDQVFEFSMDDNEKLVRGVHSSGWGFNAIYRLLRNFKNKIIADEGLEAAEEQIPEYELETLSTASDELSNVPLSKQGHMYSSPALQNQFDTDEDDDVTKETKQPKGAEVKNFSQADLDAAAAAASAKAEAKFAHRAKCEKIVATWGNEGKTVPAMENGLVDFMEGLETKTEFTFSEGTGDNVTEKSVSAFDFFEGMMNAMPNNFAALSRELCSDDSDPKGDEVVGAHDLAKRASEFMAAEDKKGRTVSFAQAIDHVNNSED